MEMDIPLQQIVEAGGSSYISGHTGCVAISSENSLDAKNGDTTGTTNNESSIHYSNFKFSQTKMIDGEGYKWTNIRASTETMPKPDDSGTEIGHTGNGYAKITFLGVKDNIQPSITITLNEDTTLNYSIKVSDDSGIKEAYYKVTQSNTENTYTDGTKIINGEASDSIINTGEAGDWYIHVYARDNVGNIKTASKKITLSLVSEIVNYTNWRTYINNLSASSSIDSPRTPQKVFDGSLNENSGCWHSTYDFPQYFVMEFKDVVKIGSLTLTNRSSSFKYCQKDFKLQGSLDGTDYVDIGEFQHESNAPSYSKTYVINENYSGFRYYRIYITSGWSYAVIGELSLTIELFTYSFL